MLKKHPMLEHIIPAFLQLSELLQWSRVNKKTNKISQLFIFKLVHIKDWNKFFSRKPCYAFVKYYLNLNRQQLWHIAEWAGYHGNLNCIEHLSKDFLVEPEEWNWAFNNACLKGRLDIVQFLHEKIGVPLTDKCWIALEYGHLKVVEYLHLKNCPFNGNSIAQTACYGNIRGLKWLHTNRLDDMIKYKEDVARGIDFCAASSNQILMKLLHSWGFRGNNPIRAAKNYQQSPKFIKWLQLQGYEE